jgi:two-component system, sensor histidine kinase and response regulator
MAQVEEVTQVRSILIVDDEYSIREALQLFFEDKGYKTKQAGNGVEALKIIEKEDFDLVISDIRMAKMDGVELLKKLDQYNKKTPVIFITAYPEINSAIEAIRHGVVEYIVKPFEMKCLEQKASDAIKRKYESSEEVLNKRFRENKIDFLSRFSHELRTPITPVSAYVKLLLKREFGAIPERQAEVIKHIERNSKRLKCTADDLILLYAVEHAEEPMDIREHRLEDMINEVMEDAGDFIRERKQKVEIKIFDNIEAVKCDGEKIRKVIYHLLDNAVKFSPVTAGISLEIRDYKYDGRSFVKFSIRDSSEKIREVNKRLLYRRFYDMAPTAEEKASDYGRGGLGLGLTLSKLIVEAHHGKIWLEESEGGTETGNIFSFILPV